MVAAEPDAGADPVRTPLMLAFTVRLNACSFVTAPSAFRACAISAVSLMSDSVTVP
jgi:hypothetical protein